MKICQSCLQFCLICVAHFSKVDDITDMANQQNFCHRKLPQVIQGIVVIPVLPVINFFDGLDDDDDVM